MGVIKINNIRIFSYHGCLKEETKIGSHYQVDLEVKANLKHSSETDDLRDTIDYVFLNDVVKKEMNRPAKLLETVASRILDHILKEDMRIKKAKVWISKLNPPIGGDVEKVTIQMTKKASLSKK